MTGTKMTLRAVYDCGFCGFTAKTKEERDNHSQIPIVPALPVGLVYCDAQYGKQSFILTGDGDLNKLKRRGSRHTYNSPRSYFQGGSDPGIYEMCTINSGRFKRDLRGRLENNNHQNIRIYTEKEFSEIVEKMSPFINVDLEAEPGLRYRSVEVSDLIRTTPTIQEWLEGATISNT